MNISLSVYLNEIKESFNKMAHIDQDVRGIDMDTSIHKQLPELLTLASDRSEQGKLILCENSRKSFSRRRRP